MDFATARHAMLENQVRANKVTNPRIIYAMDEVPRERFVPQALRDVAYLDEDLAIGGGRYLMEPMVMARLMQVAAIGAGDTVLDIGCGTGYSTAVLARVAKAVVAVEGDEALAHAASENLSALSIDNAAVVTGDPHKGCAKQGPYDVIFIGGAVGEIPKVLTNQLAPGGRLVAVVLDDKGMGRATVVRRDGGQVTQAVVFDAAVRSLPGFEKTQSFVF